MTDESPPGEQDAAVPEATQPANALSSSLSQVDNEAQESAQALLPEASTQRTAESETLHEKAPDRRDGGAQGGAPRKLSTKPPRAPIETIEDLIRDVYESKSRLLEFATDRLKKLPVLDDQIPRHSELVASLAKSDPTLTGPFKLLQYVASRGVQLTSDEGSPLQAILARLRDLAVLALGSHPVFRVWNDQLLDPHLGPQLTGQVVRDLARRVTAEDLGMAEDEFKVADHERLRRNAIACLSILRSLQRSWNVERVVDESNSVLWSVEMPKGISDEKAAAMIVASRDPEVLGIVAKTYSRRVEELHRGVSKLEREAEAAANREARLSSELRAMGQREESALARAKAFSADIVRLQKELAAERDSRVVDKSHMADDYETLRTRIIRRLGGEIDLLTDALHALRNGASPVAEEFLDRSLLALSREVEQLKDAAGGLA